MQSPGFTVMVHLLVILPSAFIGGWLLLARKGTAKHKTIGKVYMVLMGFTGIWTLFIPAATGPVFLNHFGFLHTLSILTLVTVPRAWLAIRHGDVTGHRMAMLLLYFGGILVAGGFAIWGEGRFLHTILFH